MAAHSLSIAKASLLASCLRPDPTKLGRDDLVQFHDLLETSISQCTPRNIQNTKQWLLQHILQSAARTAALSKYLASLSKNIDFLPSDIVHARPCRRHLHLLYLLNDVFHHVKHHSRDDLFRRNVQEHVPSILPSIFTKALEEKKSRTTRRLTDLLDIWSKEKYCNPEQLAALRNTALRNTALPGNATQSKAEREDTKVETLKETPWSLPPTHGDPNAPFFDLPAANLMPHIIPNSARPIRPDQVHPLQLNAGLADESLVNAIKDFLRDIKSINDPYGVLQDEGIVADIDEMGQISYRNEADDVVGDTYYGWSRAFCEKMRNRGKEAAADHGDHLKGRRSRSRSRSSDSMSRSRSGGLSPRKRRRRYSTSRSRSRSHSRSATQSRSRSPYHNDSPPPRRGFTAQSTRRPSPPKQPHSRSYSPNAPPPRFQGSSHQNPPNPHPQMSPSVPPPPPPFHHPPPFPQGPGNYPHMHGPGATSPPPKPPNWNGPWPPPPPPPPPGPGFATGSVDPNMMFPPHLPPPPPPLAYQNYGNASGSGSGNGSGYGSENGYGRR